MRAFRHTNNTHATVTPPVTPLAPPFPLDEAEVVHIFKRQNIRKAAGPDGVYTATLSHCANELAPVFTDIFNMSLSLQSIPSCFKFSTIIPVPKKPKVTSLNDYGTDL